MIVKNQNPTDQTRRRVKRIAAMVEEGWQVKQACNEVGMKAETYYHNRKVVLGVAPEKKCS